ncbi:hypothetical protein Hanom_Chr00s002855g01706191 [Helianthus anomalus]
MRVAYVGVCCEIFFKELGHKIEKLRERDGDYTSIWVEADDVEKQLWQNSGGV